MPVKSYKDQVKELRAAMGGITQVELAIKLGKSYPTVQRYESEAAAPPAVELGRLALIAKATGRLDLAKIFAEGFVEEISLEVLELVQDLVSSEEDHASITEKTTSEGPPDRRRKRAS